jgi:hypothetical protein
VYQLQEIKYSHIKARWHDKDEKNTYNQFVIALKALLGFYSVGSGALYFLLKEVSINTTTKTLNYRSLTEMSKNCKSLLMSLIKSKQSKFTEEVKGVFRSINFNTILSKYISSGAELDYYVWANLYFISSVPAIVGDKEFFDKIATIEDVQVLSSTISVYVKNLIIDGTISPDIEWIDSPSNTVPEV